MIVSLKTHETCENCLGSIEPGVACLRIMAMVAAKTGNIFVCEGCIIIAARLLSEKNRI